ncbi:acetamidase/formamidase family protein, partial [Bordetella pertussis]
MSQLPPCSRGSRVYFPVYVKGGGLSMGDIH